MDFGGPREEGDTRMDKQMDKRMDGQEFPRVLQDFVPFGAVAQGRPRRKATTRPVGQ